MVVLGNDGLSAAKQRLCHRCSVWACCQEGQGVAGVTRERVRAAIVVWLAWPCPPTWSNPGAMTSPLPASHLQFYVQKRRASNGSIGKTKATGDGSIWVHRQKQRGRRVWPRDAERARTSSTVGKWRSRYAKERIEALADEVITQTLGQTIDLQHRYRHPDQQSMRSPDCKCDHLLQLCYPFSPPGQISNEQKCQSVGPSEEDLSNCLAAYLFSRPLYLLWQKNSIDLDAILANLALEEGDDRLPQIMDSIRLDPEILWQTA